MQFQSLREVYASEPARLLLTLLAESAKPVPYSVARRRLDIHPQQFQRAVELLEKMALTGRVLEPTDGEQHSVYLEPTFTGRHLTALWVDFEQKAQQDQAFKGFEFTANWKAGGTKKGQP